MKKLFAESVLSIIVAPIILSILYWFSAFVITTYQAIAEVNNQKEDILEIKQDVKEVKNFLLTKGR